MLYLHFIHPLHTVTKRNQAQNKQYKDTKENVQQHAKVITLFISSFLFIQLSYITTVG